MFYCFYAQSLLILKALLKGDKDGIILRLREMMMDDYEYKDDVNEISKVYCLTREKWKNLTK